MTRSKSGSKKRFLSKSGSAEKQVSKKSKPTTVKSKSVDEATETPASSVTLNPSAVSPDITTPKGKFSFDSNFDGDGSTDTSIEDQFPEAPPWAQVLIAKLGRVETLSASTQTAITNLVSSNEALTKNVTALTSKVNSLEAEITMVKTENVDLKEKLLKLEFHQRRNNLIFEGIAETSSHEPGRDCYDKIMQALLHLPDMDLSGVRVDRCHRLGPVHKSSNKPRPIIAKFNWYGDLVEILSKRNYLPQGVYVSEDFADEWVDRRRLLRPILNLAKKTPKYKDSAFLTRDKLVINGKQFTVAPTNNLAELPSNLLPSKTCKVQNEGIIAFLGPHSVFSNFHPAKFSEGRIKYNCAEQMIQAEKAALFKDTVSLLNIMKMSCPFCIKAAGNRIRNFDKEIWKKESKRIVTKAVTAKFRQNSHLSNLLKSTGKVEIVESSKDHIWGTGIHLHDKNALNRSAWQGNGLMSEILSAVCMSLK